MVEIFKNISTCDLFEEKQHNPPYGAKLTHPQPSKHEHHLGTSMGFSLQQPNLEGRWHRIIITFFGHSPGKFKRYFPNSIREDIFGFIIYVKNNFNFGAADPCSFGRGTKSISIFSHIFYPAKISYPFPYGTNGIKFPKH